MEKKTKNDTLTTFDNCPEFPFFGARYPDAQCHEGYLWDLDSGEDGQLSGGGEIPCPFCNREQFLEYQLDDDCSEDRKAGVIKWIEQTRAKYSPLPSPPKPPQP